MARYEILIHANRRATLGIAKHIVFVFMTTLYVVTIPTTEAAPVAPTQLSPVSSVSLQPPTFQWSHVADATWYRLWVTDSTGVVVKRWYRSSDACSASVCIVSPGTTVSGQSTWQVRGYDGSLGQWSARGRFTTEISRPNATTLISPLLASGSVSSEFEWEIVDDATWYKLELRDSSSSQLFAGWLRADSNQVDCNISRGSCRKTPVVTLTSDFDWRVRTYNSAGLGPWTSWTTVSASGGENVPLIVIDQFGYQPDRAKVAVLRNPQVGYDQSTSYTPSSPLAVINTADNQVVFTGNPVPWNTGQTDESSGDKVWWFDFSSVVQPGTYRVVDQANGVSSPSFDIDNNVYRQVLRESVRTFFYQRSGYSKQPPDADVRWSDSASHLGSLQDSQARRYNAPNDPTTERDLSGGWYDAGDFNKYTNWTAEYVISLLHSYLENPAIWTDDFDIPESGNGIPDLLDEIRWGVEWLVRMQNIDGSVLSIVGSSHASPPSTATGQSLYGNANTSATLNTAAALAIASKVFAGSGIGELENYATQLETRAEDAWDWAEDNPAVIFRNNDAVSGTSGLGAGQQEVDAFKLSMIKLGAAVYLAGLTGDNEYESFVNDNYQSARLLLWTYVDPYENYPQRDLLYYSRLADVSTSVSNDIKTTYSAAMQSGILWGAVDTKIDPYRAHLDVYTWGSNQTKASKGMLFIQMLTNGLGSRSPSAIRDAAGGFLHYLHGVNPQGIVYLSNMAESGAEYSVDTFYHTWFSDGSTLWDSVTESQHGPAPGFLVGGPNPYYGWDPICSGGNNQTLCGDSIPSPPAGQPDQKSYLQFNDDWPINSWEVTENSNGYQAAYIRLLTQFVSP